MSPISPAAARRRRLLTRFLPLATLALAAFIVGLVIGAKRPVTDAADRFATAWTVQNFSAMHEELSDDAARQYPLKRFEELYKAAETTATITSITHGAPDGPHSLNGRDVVTVPVTIRTNAFGELAGKVNLPVDGNKLGWAPNLVFPSLNPGEQLARRMNVPKRAAILANNGSSLASGSADSRTVATGASAVVGEVGLPHAKQERGLDRLGFPKGTSAGTSGLEKAFNTRLAGKPGGELLAQRGNKSRTIATSSPTDGTPVHTTIDPSIQSDAVTALGNTYGGVAVLNAQNGSVLGLAGIAFSAPQPPGSTFKIVTTTAALDNGAVSLHDSFPIQSSTTVDGREVANAHNESCGGTFTEAFAESCNSVFAPLGPKIGSDKLVSTAEAYGFNSNPTLYDPSAAAVQPPQSTIPKDIPTDLDLAVSAIGQGEVLATPLELASIAQTIAAKGVRSPTPLVTDAGLKTTAKPVKVTSPQTAGTIRDLMIDVVNNGTGIHAQLSGVQVAGKTGTAELGPKTTSPTSTGATGAATENQKLDAWFTSFAPAGAPKYVVAVMVVNANGDGGEVAAPIAANVLSSQFGG